MTRQTDWLPRLERLALACKLDEFEKVVLLTLVGGVISQDISSLNYDFMTGQRNSGFTVGGLLQLFCKGFQEEIKARHAFLSSSSCVCCVLCVCCVCVCVCVCALRACASRVG
jgi:hypothetical protein